MKQIRSCLGVVLIASLSGGPVGAAAPSKAHCDKVIATASGAFTGPNTVGTDVSLVINGTQMSATSIATLLEATQVGNGATFATTSHVFNFATGTFTTSDRAMLLPTNTPGLVRLNSHVEVTGGTGAFAGAYGDLVGHGFLSFVDGSVVWELRGMLCIT